MLIPTVAFILSAFAPEVWAQDEELEAKFIFETNFTDGDTGIQWFTDGEPWDEVKVWDPDGKLILDIKAKGNLKGFGLTEGFGESNEPNWREEDAAYTLREIVELFPADEYTFVAKLVEGGTLEGTAELSDVLPCAPVITAPAEGAELANGSTVTIQWNPVTDELDIDLDTVTDTDCSGGPISEGTVGAYQVIVENLATEKEFSIFLDALPANNKVTLPSEFVADDTVFKFEVFAIQVIGEELRNQTITESYFCIGLTGDDCTIDD
jgi:hypothetical protein